MDYITVGPPHLGHSYKTQSEVKLEPPPPSSLRDVLTWSRILTRLAILILSSSHSSASLAPLPPAPGPPFVSPADRASRRFRLEGDEDVVDAGSLLVCAPFQRPAADRSRSTITCHLRPGKPGHVLTRSDIKVSRHTWGVPSSTAVRPAALALMCCGMPLGGAQQSG
jgi:hypothetical protein